MLLSRSPLGKKCQATFFHSTVGVPITPDDLHYVARVGMEHGAGVELQPDSLFTLTMDQHVPGLAEMMKVKSVSDVENLKAPTSVESVVRPSGKRHSLQK